MNTLNSPLTILPKVGPAVARNFERLQIRTVRDLLWHLPLRYLDFRNTIPVGKIKPGQNVTIQGTIKTISASYAFRGRLARTEGVLSDPTGSIKIIWFNQPYIAKALAAGDEIAVAGTAVYYKNVLQLQNPIYEKLGQENIHTGRLVPVYPGSTVVSNRAIRNLVAAALPAIEYEPDVLPSAVQKQNTLMPLALALSTLHFPESEKDLDEARNRIAFEELLVHQLAARLQEATQAKVPAPVIPLQTEFIANTLKTLPFELTASQKRSLWETMQDMARGEPMVRLLQGDVGSGKTLVAALSALEGVVSGWQSAFVAPTEILASQHFKYLQKYLPECTIGLLSRNFAEISGGEKLTKKELLAKVASGEIHILVGTHAVLQKEVSFHKLGLAIIDEQHRFGVAQRSFMLKQEQFADLTPHLLSMSATPIPRTLALTFYGNLKISSLTTIPTGIKQITTTVAKEDERDQIYKKLKVALDSGAQAFIVTPRVEENELSSLKSVKEEFARLERDIFPKTPMGLLYGSMKGADKEAAMSAFNQGKTKILVATSVIEIGIDVPAASFMIIEGAERFGLAQLHQLRGRIGRAGQKSHCILFTASEDPKTLERLKFFASCNDGFQLAEKDLQQRGFGNLFGTEQTGFSFQFARFFTVKTVKAAQTTAIALIKKSANLSAFPKLRAKVVPLLQETHGE
jgi:ATP-dependent DNA helicase RecG